MQLFVHLYHSCPVAAVHTHVSLVPMQLFTHMYHFWLHAAVHPLISLLSHAAVRPLMSLLSHAAVRPLISLLSHAAVRPLISLLSHVAVHPHVSLLSPCSCSLISLLSHAAVHPLISLVPCSCSSAYITAVPLQLFILMYHCCPISAVHRLISLLSYCWVPVAIAVKNKTELCCTHLPEIQQPHRIHKCRLHDCSMFLYFLHTLLKWQAKCAAFQVHILL